MRVIALLLPFLLISCAETLHENAVAICSNSRHCTVTDTSPAYGPPQQAVINQPPK